MRLYNIYGNLVNKTVSRYLIKWDAKSLSLPQFKTKQFLKQYWLNHVLYEEFPVYGTKLRLDIFNATLKIAIEVNGPQHREFHHFHNKSPSAYILGMKNDIKKAEWLEKNNIQLIEIMDTEVPLLSKDFFYNKFGVLL